MNGFMKQQKQLNLTCYKMEIAMSVEAWYFLYGTTCGTCNLFYFFSLLSGMATEDTTCNKRGMTYIIHPGQADGSMLSLAKEWNIGRKAVSRLLEDFSKRGLIRIVSNPVTSIIDMVCVKSWMKDGQVIENPTYLPVVKAYEGVRIYLFNGQRLELLRKSSAVRKKQPKGESEKTMTQAEQPSRKEPTARPFHHKQLSMIIPLNQRIGHRQYRVSTACSMTSPLIIKRQAWPGMTFLQGCVLGLAS